MSYYYDNQYNNNCDLFRFTIVTKIMHVTNLLHVLKVRIYLYGIFLFLNISFGEECLIRLQLS